MGWDAPCFLGVSGEGQKEQGRHRASPHAHTTTRPARDTKTPQESAQGKGGPTSVKKAVVLTLRTYLTTLAAYHSKREREAGQKRYRACTQEGGARSTQQAAGRGVQPGMQQHAADKHAVHCPAQSTHRPAAPPRKRFFRLLKAPRSFLIAACDLFPLHRDISSRFSSSAEASGGQEQRAGAEGSKKARSGGLCILIGQVWSQQLLPLWLFTISGGTLSNSLLQPELF